MCRQCELGCIFFSPPPPSGLRTRLSETDQNKNTTVTAIACGEVDTKP